MLAFRLLKNQIERRLESIRLKIERRRRSEGKEEGEGG
jgi:hypothetical protein